MDVHRMVSVHIRTCVYACGVCMHVMCEHYFVGEGLCVRVHLYVFRLRECGCAHGRGCLHVCLCARMPHVSRSIPCSRYVVLCSIVRVSVDAYV